MMQPSEKLIDLLRRQVRTVVLTGAGVSAESGVPTFRGGHGLWDKYNPMELASIDGFTSDPRLVWQWYLYRRDIVARVSPNPGHETLAAIQRQLKDFTLVTQNVDNLHQDAGSIDVIELHGNIMQNKCFECGKRLGEMTIDPDSIPTCSCGGMVRPAVVWFGETLPVAALSLAQEKSQAAELFFSIGTSAEVYPAAQLPLLGKRAGAYLVEINPTPTPLSPLADETLQGKSGEILLSLWEAVSG